MNNVQIMLIILNSVNIEEYTNVFFLGKAYIQDYVSVCVVWSHSALKFSQT
jgi:hypothetical protein